MLTLIMQDPFKRFFQLVRFPTFSTWSAWLACYAHADNAANCPIPCFGWLFAVFAQHDMTMNFIRKDLFEAIFHLGRAFDLASLACLLCTCQQPSHCGLLFAAFAQHDMVMTLIRKDLFQAILQLGKAFIWPAWPACYAHTNDLPMTYFRLLFAAFAQHDMMMTLIREDLFQAILQLGKTSNLACLSGVTQVVLGLYVHLGKHLLLQLEAYLNLVLLRVAEGKGAGLGGGGGGSDHQEAALEVMLQVSPNPLLVCAGRLLP